MPKHWYQSKTIQVAIVTGILGIVGAMASQYPDVSLLVTAQSMLMVILRLLTTEPIK